MTHYKQGAGPVQQRGLTTIASLIDGLADALLVHPGPLIKSNEAGLVVLHQVQPVDVQFSVAEKYLAFLRQRLQQGGARVPPASPCSFIWNNLP
ncbi:MAG: hypothetical protein H7838_08855 [Magnetococcus sp. DMHC-8]